jgi:hypothetical protein
MGDSWEDEDDLEERLPPVPSGLSSAAAPSNWEDEEDQVEIDAPMKAMKLTAEQIAANEKKAYDAEIAYENKLKTDMLRKETPEDRKARERRAAEESDNALAGELFGTGGSSSAASPMSGRIGGGMVVLKTKQDHSTYGNSTSQKLAASSAFNIAAFYKSLSKTCDNPLITSEVLNEIIGDLTKIRDKKLEKEKPAAKPVVAKKSKKQMQKETQKHNDVFGGADDYGDNNDAYADMEDSFM